MPLTNAFIPYGAYWSTPFSRWQGSLSRSHSIELAAQVGRRFLETGGIEADAFDGLILGTTVPQRHGFYGAPWLAAMLGAERITGPTLSQACATSARVLASAALEVESGQRSCILAVACDRTSNGPHVVYPDPGGVGGRGTVEDPVWDSFQHDPHAGGAMIETAERVAREAELGRAEQDALTLLRYEQYARSLADGRAFQRRYMLPVEIGRGRSARTLEEDEGVHPTTAEGLAGLRPVLEGGSVTFGTQTHPADGNAGVVVCSRERAAELSRDPGIRVRLLGFGEARVEKGRMPKATVPAALAALERAGVGLEDCAAIHTHNPFAVNDLYFCRELGLAPEELNKFGSPLIYGHPQAPTGMRALIELIEELALLGGGRGLFTGCAAGDTGMAVVLEVRA